MTADFLPLRLLLAILAGWVNRHQQDVIDYLVEENRALREQLRGGRVQLKDNGIPPAPGRPSSWRTFLRAHWGVIAGADFFTTEVWTARGLVTYYTVFVLDLASRARFMGFQSKRRLSH